MARVAGVREKRGIEGVGASVGAPVRGAVRLVIGRVDEGGGSGRHAIADAGRRVVHELRAELDATDRELGLAELDEVHLRRQRLERDREICVVHRPADRRREAPIHARGSVDGDVAAGRERGQKEREALDVVGVCV